MGLMAVRKVVCLHGDISEVRAEQSGVSWGSEGDLTDVSFNQDLVRKLDMLFPLCENNNNLK